MTHQAGVIQTLEAVSAPFWCRQQGPDEEKDAFTGSVGLCGCALQQPYCGAVKVNVLFDQCEEALTVF